MDKSKDLFSFDGQLGPAKAIGNDDQEFLIDSVLDQWSGASVPPRQSYSWSKAAGYALAAIMATSTAATAAWVYYERTQSPLEVEAQIIPTPKTSIPAPLILPAEKPSTEVTPKKVVVAQPKRRPQRARTKFKAEDLLKQANGLRRVQDWNRAARAYAVVGKKFRGSDSEYVALVSEAEIQLRQLSNIERAKKCYERALSLRPAGVLGAEILFGLAEVSGLENNHAEETRFLRRLIEKYEHSPFADLAKDRLEQQ